MITGAHAMIYSKDSDADRAFLRDVLGLGHVDVGGGWLIFGLPPSEIAVHPGKKSAHEIYFMCEDVNAFRSFLEEKKITTSPVQDQGWGLVTTVTLPGGGELGVYEPRHARPESASAAPAKSVEPPARGKRAASNPPAKAVAKKAAAKKAAAKKAPAKKAPATSASASKASAGKAPAKAAAKSAKKAPAPAKKSAAPAKVKKASRAGR